MEDSMHVRFSDVDGHYIKGKVESGFYTSENEAVRDAVRRMREEEERIARFQAAVRIGDEQIERGETVPYSKELMEQISQRAVQRAKQGKTIDNPDVLP
jgi:antitoxin ParD1/3/4